MDDFEFFLFLLFFYCNQWNIGYVSIFFSNSLEVTIDFFIGF